jgi:hypothetical protein
MSLHLKCWLLLLMMEIVFVSLATSSMADVVCSAWLLLATLEIVIVSL